MAAKTEEAAPRRGAPARDAVRDGEAEDRRIGEQRDEREGEEHVVAARRSPPRLARSAGGTILTIRYAPVRTAARHVDASARRADAAGKARREKRAYPNPQYHRLELFKGAGVRRQSRLRRRLRLRTRRIRRLRRRLRLRHGQPAPAAGAAPPLPAAPARAAPPRRAMTTPSFSGSRRALSAPERRLQPRRQQVTCVDEEQLEAARTGGVRCGAGRGVG